MIALPHVIATLLALAGTAAAQSLVGAVSSRPAKESTGPTVLTVSPAPAPSPVLLYQLLPDLLEQTPGNALPIYYVALDLLDGAEGEGMAKFHEAVQELLDRPLAEMSLEQARVILTRHRQALEQVDLAARRETCVWDAPIRSQGINMPLPSLVRFRTLARLVTLQARVQIAERHYNEACRTLQSSLAMARHVADGPTLINALVGVAMADLALQRVRELSQQPGAPNLYWALTDLPRPFIDLRRSMQFERSILVMTFPQLRNIADTDMSPQQWEAAAAQFIQMLNGITTEQPPEIGWEQRLGIAAVCVKVYPQAKARLIATGQSPEKVTAMPVQKVVLLDMLDRYGEQRDELFKWFGVPYWQAAEHLWKFEEAAGQIQRDELNPFMALLPSLGRAYFRAVKLDRTIAAQRCVEAIRLHAAANEGRPPASLEEIKAAPMPIDPTTGAAFRYERTASGVVLESPAPPGASPTDSLRYQVTISTTK